MSCLEFNEKIAEYLDNQLDPAERALLEQHVATCSDCRATAQQWRELDFALSRTIQAPALKPGFETRLQTRIQAEANLLSQTERAERKAALQAEFQTGLKRLHKISFGAFDLLDGLGIATMAALGGWLIFSLLHKWVANGGWHNPWVGLIPPLGSALLLAGALGVVFLQVAKGKGEAVL